MWTRGQEWTWRAFRQSFVRWIFIQRQLSDKLCSLEFFVTTCLICIICGLWQSVKANKLYCSLIQLIPQLWVYWTAIANQSTRHYYIAVKIPFINCSNKTLDQLSIYCLIHHRKQFLVLCNWQLQLIVPLTYNTRCSFFRQVAGINKH